MPECPKCGASMATVMRRGKDGVETRYECPKCEKNDNREDQRDSDEAEKNK